MMADISEQDAASELAHLALGSFLKELHDSLYQDWPVAGNCAR
jgi:hypothetical protein